MNARNRVETRFLVERIAAGRTHSIVIPRAGAATPPDTRNW